MALLGAEQLEKTVTNYVPETIRVLTPGPQATRGVYQLVSRRIVPLMQEWKRHSRMTMEAEV